MIQVHEIRDFHASEVNEALRELQDAGAEIVDVKYTIATEIDEFNNSFNQSNALVIYKVKSKDVQGVEIEKNHPIEDIMGMEIKPGDVYYRIDENDVVLERNLAEYFAEFYDAEKRVAGE